MLQIRTFGGLTIQRGDDRVLGAAAQPRRMAILAMVARAGERGISRDRLQATLWPDADDEQGKNALKQALYALRRDADVADLFIGTREIRFNPDEVECDVARFEDLIRRDHFEKAVALCDGRFLEGFRLAAVPEFESWMEDERRALDRTLASGLERLGAAALKLGDAGAAVRWYLRLAALEPLTARYTVALMEALLADGDRAGALRQARIYEALTAQELDLPPDDSVVNLARQIRDGRVRPVGPPPGRVNSASNTVAAAPDAVQQNAASTTPAGAATGSSPANALSVAVAPFNRISSDPDVGHLADGLTEELISALGRLRDVRVTGRLPATLVEDGAVDAAAVASRYGVAAVIEGSVRQSEHDVRVNARLLRIPDAVVLWSARFDRPAGNPLALQDELARAIAEGAERELRLVAGLPSAPSLRERADELYAAGLRAWTPEGAGLGQGLEQFRQAIALFPAHARAHAALAEAYTQLGFYGFLPAHRAKELVSAASREAMRLAPDIAESHLARGTCLLWVDRDFAEGTAELERAIALDPSNAVAQARLAFVRVCHDGPREPAREAALRDATMAGAPGQSRVIAGLELLAARRYDDAIEALHAAIDVDAPSFLAYHWLCAAYLHKGDASEAITAAVAESSISQRHPWSQQSLISACALAGQQKRAETLLETLKARAASGYVQYGVLGLAYAAIGDVAMGMRYLEQAVDAHEPAMMMLRSFPMYEPFHEQPGFRPLLRRAGWRDWDTTEFRIPVA